MVQNTRKLTEPDFSSNSCWSKFGQKLAKNGLFQRFLKIELFFGWKHAKMLDIMVRMYGGTQSMSGKILVWPNFGQNDHKNATNQIASYSKCYNF